MEAAQQSQHDHRAAHFCAAYVSGDGEMSNVYVPEVSVKIAVAGEEVARFAFDRTDRNPQEWEITAAIDRADSKSAIRACLLACVAELQQGDWLPYSFVPESGGTEDDQPQLI